MKKFLTLIWLSWLGLSGLCMATGTVTGVTTWLTDSDGDGVSDEQDRCPGTPIGIAVNAYGCPLSVSSCDYTTSTITLTSSGGSAGTNINTRYILANNTGTILQVATVPTFSGLSGTATYMALAVTYEGTISNLSVGQALSAVSATCFNWSNALVFKACVAPPATCDYQIGQTISVNSAGGSVGTGIMTKYVLTNATGVIVQVSNQPSFPSIGLLEGIYIAYAVTYIEDGSINGLLANGVNTIGTVSANCLKLSAGLELRLCQPCVPRCIPVVISRIKL